MKVREEPGMRSPGDGANHVQVPSLSLMRAPCPPTPCSAGAGFGWSSADDAMKQRIWMSLQDASQEPCSPARDVLGGGQRQSGQSTSSFLWLSKDHVTCEL